MQAVVQILASLAGPRVAEAVRKTVNEMFGVYTQALAAGFAKYTKPDGTLPPRLGEPRSLCLCIRAFASCIYRLL